MLRVFALMLITPDSKLEMNNLTKLSLCVWRSHLKGARFQWLLSNYRNQCIYVYSPIRYKTQHISYDTPIMIGLITIVHASSLDSTTK